MGNGKAKGKSFWKTLPGILSQIAAIIIAVTGLIAGLHAAGIIGVPPGDGGGNETNGNGLTSFTFYPNPASLGEEVTLYLNEAVAVLVTYNGQPLPKKVFSGGKVLVVTVPGNAVSGYLELSWDGKSLRAEEPLTVIG